ncbi:copper amine oxidase N-terminal domain-containing protein [Lysinibacillus sp. MHQ-1]|nr:copper amine oxidase N-terminal domain-containing protein [Lysinibacillus sp. MHQ-1]
MRSTTMMIVTNMTMMMMTMMIVTNMMMKMNPIIRMVKYTKKGTWNIWTRELVMEKEVLPFSMSKLVNLKVVGMNKELNFLCYPKRRGVFLYQGKTVAQLLGAKATFYKTSKILDIQYQENELVFRSGTNVVYDNNVKTPLPASSFYLNEELYVPISVITNGLGYVVEWQEDNQMFLCQLLIK